MLQAAVEKLQAELQTNSAPYIQVIGEYLIHHVTAVPTTAENILAERKTIAGAFQAMASEAQRRVTREENAREAMVVLTDQEGLEIVLTYYGIEGGVLQDGPPTAEVSEQPAKMKKASAAKQKKPAKKVVQFPGNEFVQTTLDDFFNESEVVSE